MKTIEDERGTYDDNERMRMLEIGYKVIRPSAAVTSTQSEVTTSPFVQNAIEQGGATEK
ncbi:MAG: hypothetical protein O3A81_02755 [bacterium]|nr:hypothetical protein [bacterium]